MATSINGLIAGLDDLSLSTKRTNATEDNQTKAGGDLGKDQFLQLLVTQMKNQDPLEPEKDSDFIAQLAQFSSLEQMQNLNETVQNSQAFGLVGKSVVINTTSANGDINEVKGVVDYITMSNGEAKMSVNGNLYPISDLAEVKDSYYAIQEFLPTVEKADCTYDKTNKSPITINLDMGQASYSASNVAVKLNGNFVDKSYLTYEKGKLSIWPGAMDSLGIGEYKVEFQFDDPYSTIVGDKVTLKVINSGVTNQDKE